MTWRELIAELKYISENRLDEQAFIYDISYNNNREGAIYPVCKITIPSNKGVPITIDVDSEDWEEYEGAD